MKAKKKIRPVIAWAVVTPDGRIRPESISVDWQSAAYVVTNYEGPCRKPTKDEAARIIKVRIEPARRAKRGG